MQKLFSKTIKRFSFLAKIKSSQTCSRDIYNITIIINVIIKTESKKSGKSNVIISYTNNLVFTSVIHQNETCIYSKSESLVATPPNFYMEKNLILILSFFLLLNVYNFFFSRKLNDGS